MMFDIDEKQAKRERREQMDKIDLFDAYIKLLRFFETAKPLLSDCTDELRHLAEPCGCSRKKACRACINHDDAQRLIKRIEGLLDDQKRQVTRPNREAN